MSPRLSTKQYKQLVRAHYLANHHCEPDLIVIGRECLVRGRMEGGGRFTNHFQLADILPSVPNTLFRIMAEDLKLINRIWINTGGKEEYAKVEAEYWAMLEGVAAARQKKVDADAREEWIAKRKLDQEKNPALPDFTHDELAKIQGAKVDTMDLSQTTEFPHPLTTMDIFHHHMVLAGKIRLMADDIVLGLRPRIGDEEKAGGKKFNLTHYLAGRTEIIGEAILSLEQIKQHPVLGAIKEALPSQLACVLSAATMMFKVLGQHPAILPGELHHSLDAERKMAELPELEKGHSRRMQWLARTRDHLVDSIRSL